MLSPAIPCKAQSPSVGDPAPFLFVYVVEYGDDVLPLIALGIEKPALKITRFEKCVKMSVPGTTQPRLAVQLTSDDAKTLIDILGKSEAASHSGATLWFTTPDNQPLGYSHTPSGIVTPNIRKAGVLDLGGDQEVALVEYLTQKLQPK